ncbi:TadE-like protein [Phycisphaerae bacterium RAS1]|nr:TadE-like protein [Phycisphaerae bacterium RAS1]
MKITGGKKLRRGAATVEMAIVTPLLLTMLFGIIEYGWVFTVKQGLTTAAREGARTAALPGSTDEDIQQRISAFLTPLGLTTYSVELTRSTEENPTETVHVLIPYADVTLVGCYFGSTSYNLGATVSMRKEGID